MKICILTHTFPRNSQDVSAAFMKEFSESLAVNGNEVVVVIPFDQLIHRIGDKFKVITYKYIWPDSLHLLGYSRSMEADVKLKKINFFLLPFLMIFGTICLYNIVRKEKIDIISVHWILPNGLMALIVSKLTGIPYTITLPGTDAYLIYRNKIFANIAKIVAENSSGIFSNSRWHLNRILSLGVRVPIADVITYPVDTNHFRQSKEGLDSLREELGLKKEDLVILAVGRLVYKKGFNYLIEAMVAIVKKFPDAVLLIGGDGDLMDDWNKLAVNLNVVNKVKFLGTLKRDKILHYYNLADIMVTPSVLDKQGNIDGRPLVILESMACGKPQIVTNLPGIADALLEGKNAILVPEKDSMALAKAIETLLLSKDLRLKMGKENRRLAQQQLSIKHVGKRYTDYFRKIVGL